MSLLDESESDLDTDGQLPSNIPQRWNGHFSRQVFTTSRLDTVVSVPLDLQELNRVLSDEERSLLGITQYIVHSSQDTKVGHGDALKFLEYVGTDSMPQGSINNSSVDRFFTCSYLSQDYAKFYLDLLWERQIRMEKQGKVGKRGNVLFYDSYLSYTIQSNQFEFAKKTLEKKFSPGKSFQDYDGFYILHNISKHHWFFVYVNKHRNYEITEFDSLACGTHSHVQLKKFLKEVYGIKKKGKKGKGHPLCYVKAGSCPQQQNHIDCLLYALLGIEFHSMGLELDPVGNSKQFLYTPDMIEGSSSVRKLGVLSLMSMSLITDTSMRNLIGLPTDLPIAWKGEIGDLTEYFEREQPLFGGNVCDMTKVLERLSSSSSCAPSSTVSGGDAVATTNLAGEREKKIIANESLDEDKKTKM